MHYAHEINGKPFNIREHERHLFKIFKMHALRAHIHPLHAVRETQCTLN